MNNTTEFLLGRIFSALTFLPRQKVSQGAIHMFDIDTFQAASLNLVDQLPI